MIIYTDGSKIQETTAYGFYIYYSDRVVYIESFNLGPSLEIADAESFAIYKAVRITYLQLKQLDTRPKEVYICIDSQPAI